MRRRLIFRAFSHGLRRGEEVIISKAGRPIARLVPIRAKRAKRIPGQDAGDIWIADDFDEPLPPEVQTLFK